VRSAADLRPHQDAALKIFSHAEGTSILYLPDRWGYYSDIERVWTWFDVKELKLQDALLNFKI
jgi:hypothetical protein